MPACRHCHSTETAGHGFSRFGKRRFRCKSCRRTFVEDPQQLYTEADKERILAAYHERMSLRGIERTFGVARQTVADWLKKAQALLLAGPMPLPDPDPDDVLELDEMWSFVHSKANPRWLWVALSRRTRQVVAWVLGDRSEETCQRLWDRLPEAYRQLATVSDCWKAYGCVFVDDHLMADKACGETAHAGAPVPKSAKIGRKRGFRARRLFV